MISPENLAKLQARFINLPPEIVASTIAELSLGYREAIRYFEGAPELGRAWQKYHTSASGSYDSPTRSDSATLSGFRASAAQNKSHGAVPRK